MLNSYGPGNRGAAFGGAALAAAPMIGSLAATGFTMTKMGAPFAPLLNPIAGFNAARMAGMGVAGAGMTAAAVALPLAIAGHMGASAVQGMHQQSMVNTAMSQYTFANPASRTGTGFTRQDSQAVGDQIRSLAYMPELLTSVDELTKLLPKLKSTGAMASVRDAAEFNKKFKEAVLTVRDVSKVLGTTMEDAAEFFAHSRRVGYLGKAEQIKNAMNARVTMGITGMSQQQYMQNEQSGSDFASAMGFSRKYGASVASKTASILSMARDSGALPEGLLEDITGQTEPGEALKSATSRVMSSSGRLAAGHLGRFLRAGASKLDANGKLVVDEAVMAKMASGQLSTSQIRAMGQRNVAGNRDFALAFEAHSERNIGEFLAKGGVTAQVGLLNDAVGQAGGRPDAVRMVLKQQGIPEGDIDLLMALYEQGQSGLAASTSNIAKTRAHQATMIQTRSPGAIWERLKTKMGDKLVKPFADWGAKVHTQIGRAIDNTIDDLIGNYVLSISEEKQKELLTAFTTQDSKALAGLIGSGTARAGIGTGRGEFMADWGRGAGESQYTGAGRFQRSANFLLGSGASNGQQYTFDARHVDGFRGALEKFNTGSVKGPSFSSKAQEEAFADTQRRLQHDMDLTMTTETYANASGERRQELLMDRAYDRSKVIGYDVGNAADWLSAGAGPGAMAVHFLDSNSWGRKNIRAMWNSFGADSGGDSHADERTLRRQLDAQDNDPELQRAAKAEGMSVAAYRQALIRQGMSPEERKRTQLSQDAPPNFATIVKNARSAEANFGDLMGELAPSMNKGKSLPVLAQITSAMSDATKATKARALADAIQSAHTKGWGEADRLASELGLGTVPSQMRDVDQEALASGLRRSREDDGKGDLKAGAAGTIDSWNRSSQVGASAALHEAGMLAVEKFDASSAVGATGGAAFAKAAQAARDAAKAFADAPSTGTREAANRAASAVNKMIEQGLEGPDKEKWATIDESYNPIIGAERQRRQAITGKKSALRGLIGSSVDASSLRKYKIDDDTIKQMTNEYGNNFVMDEAKLNKLGEIAGGRELTKGILADAGTQVQDAKDKEMITTLRVIAEAVISNMSDKEKVVGKKADGTNKTKADEMRERAKVQA
jgi:hypothetical protein